MFIGKRKALGILVAMSLVSVVTAAIAQEAPSYYQSTLALPPSYAWMSPDVKLAWSKGYEGKGVTVTFVDEYTGNDPFSGSWTGKKQTQLHGFFTLEEAQLLAPQATFVEKNFNGQGSAVSLHSGLNVINLSYAIYASKIYSGINWTGDKQEQSIISDAMNGKAVISKAAGNNSVAIGSANSQGNIDFLNTSLEGAQSVIYAGALNAVGSTGKEAMATYSNTAGSNTFVQQHFLTVDVNSAQTGLAGTSFAAPIISGYAAIIGSKFTKASATQITNQLLDTAITSTLVNYNAATYGRGEASLANAIAPSSIH